VLFRGEWDRGAGREAKYIRRLWVGLRARPREYRPTVMTSSSARNAASVRVLTANFKKMCLTCDFTVSGEIPRAWAICLLEEPRLISARTSDSRSVTVSLMSLPGSADRPSA
jgi:hypothetical protein